MSQLVSEAAAAGADVADDLEETITLRAAERVAHDRAPSAGSEIPPPHPPRPAGVTAAVARKLVLFSDGTGNSAAKSEKTNVWRMFQALDLTSSDQLALYDDGVGTSTNKYLAALGGAIGWGLKRNVIDLYKFVCRNHVDDTTEIYGFGFSRGAFTIRVLMGLITSEGLVNFTSEVELHQRAVEAYGHFRRKCFKPAPFSPVYIYRLLRYVLAAIIGRSAQRAPYGEQRRREVRRIKFLGLWDTVSAYGMPIAELKPAINWLFWPMYFSDLKLSPKIDRACHALSLDDERTTFHPILWDEKDEQDRGRITQVWFAGAHANVGGGYPEDQLSLISLDWMMRHAQERGGLRLQDAWVERVSQEKSLYGRIYNSRAGLGAFYRYSPREVRPSKGEREAGVVPIIHGSVITRMSRGSDAYVPNLLPREFLVLAPNGKLLPMQGFFDPDATRQVYREYREYIESADDATRGPPAAGSADQRTDELKKAMEALNSPDRVTFDRILDTIWWRRVAYLGSFALALWMVLYPWLTDDDDADFSSGWATAALQAPVNAFHKLDEQLQGTAKATLETFSMLIPNWFETWTETIKLHPVGVLALCLAFIGSLAVSETLRRRMQDYGLVAWHTTLREPFRENLLHTETSLTRRSQYLLLIADLFFFLFWYIPITRQGMVDLMGIALLLNVLILVRILLKTQLIRSLRSQPASDTAQSNVGHVGFTQWVRTNKTLGLIYDNVAGKIVPAGCALALVFLLTAGVNRVAFDLQSGSGMYCQPTVDSSPAAQKKLLAWTTTTATSQFATDQFCWSSGRMLAEKTRYRIIVHDVDGNWFDRKTHTDPKGFTASNMLYFLATPFKRWWREPWFGPVARVGATGNHEYPLQPCIYRSDGKSIKATRELTTYPDRISEQEALALQKAEAKKRDKERQLLVAEFTPETSGELFLFVNDAVLAVPRHADYFYKNNRGTASVTIEQIHQNKDSAYHYYCPK